MDIRYTKLGLVFILSWLGMAQAANLTITCPPQEYALAGSESNYYFINGLAKVTWQNEERILGDRGRFLNPGFPLSFSLKATSIETQNYSDRRGISFYCDLTDATATRVAFATTSFLLSDLGIKGIVGECKREKEVANCEVLDL